MILNDTYFFFRHQKIPFTLRYSEECGRGMIATRDIKRGEVIVEESPAVWGPKVGNDSEVI